MKPWHWSRIKIPGSEIWAGAKERPFQAESGKWVFFFIHYRHDATKTCFRNSFVPMTTIGLDGVE